MVILTAEEERRVLAMRAAKAEEEQRTKREQAKWDAEQKRLDTPGTGCLDCNKTERQVHLEGKYDSGDRRTGGFGFITLSQWTGGGGMVPRVFTTISNARLCCDCLQKRVAALRRDKR